MSKPQENWPLGAPSPPLRHLGVQPPRSSLLDSNAQGMWKRVSPINAGKPSQLNPHWREIGCGNGNKVSAWVGCSGATNLSNTAKVSMQRKFPYRTVQPPMASSKKQSIFPTKHWWQRSVMRRFGQNQRTHTHIQFWQVLCPSGPRFISTMQSMC